MKSSSWAPRIQDSHRTKKLKPGSLIKTVIAFTMTPPNISSHLNYLRLWVIKSLENHENIPGWIEMPKNHL